MPKENVCHAPGCTDKPPRGGLPFCYRHWNAVPLDLQKELNHLWSKTHLPDLHEDALNEAIEWLRQHEVAPAAPPAATGQREGEAT